MSNSKTFYPTESPDWRYLAGLWDGEGCVGICCVRQKRKDGTYSVYWDLRLMLSNTSEKLIRSLLEEFGGNAHFGSKVYPYAKKIANQWKVQNSRHSLHILRNILPFLRYKDEEAKLAIEFLSGVERNKGVSLSASEVDRRNDLIERIRQVAGRRVKPVRAEKMEHRTPNASLNQIPGPRNKSGIIGVSWIPSKGKWMAHKGKDGKNKTLGYSDTKEGAAAIRAARDLEDAE